MSNLTVHPAAVRTQILNRDAIDNSGTIWSMSVVGRPGITILHILCVDITLHPSAKATFSGHAVLCRLWTGMPSITNIWVAPESAIASFNAILSVAYSPFTCFHGAVKENMLYYDAYTDASSFRPSSLTQGLLSSLPRRLM